MARKTIVAAVFGHPTWLYGHTRYTQAFVEEDGKRERPAAEPMQWMPGRIVARLRDKPVLERRPALDNQAKKLRGRWVTIFRYSTRERETRWFLELYVTSDGTILVNPTKDKTKRLEWAPTYVGDGNARENELPRHVAGSPWQYSLIGTPFRLSDECVDTLEKNNRVIELTQPIDLATDQYVIEASYYDDSGKKVVLSRELALPVLLPFDVARQLAADITLYRSQRNNQMGLVGVKGRPTDEQVEAAKCYALSRGLDQLARNPDFESVRNDFAPAKLASMRARMQVHEAQLARLELAIEATADDLTRWLDRGLFGILLDGCEPNDEHRLLGAMDEILSSLPESALGLRRLLKMLESVRFRFYSRYFAPEEPLAETAASNAEKAGGAFVNLLSTIMSVRLLYGHANVTSVLHTIESKFGAIGPGWQTADLDVRVEHVRQFAMLRRLQPGADVDATFPVRLEGIIANDEALERMDAFVGKAGAALNFLAAINLAFAIRTFFDTPATEKALRLERGIDAAVAGAGLLGALVEKTLELMGGEATNIGARVFLRSIGIITAAHTLYSGMKQYFDAAEAGDWDACAALMTSIVLTLVSSALSTFAVFASQIQLGAWALVIGLVGTAFYVLYLFLKDSPLELLVAHSAFGVSSDDSDDGHPRWSPVPYDQLAGSWDHQLTALLTLREQFGIAFGERVKIEGRVSPYYALRIHTGAVNEQTKFHVEWRWEAHFGNGRQEQVWTAVLPSSASGKNHAFGSKLGVDDEKVLYFDVEAPAQAWTDNGYGQDRGSYGFKRLEVRVRKECSRGNTAVKLPLDGPLELEIQVDAQAPDTGLRKFSIAE